MTPDSREVFYTLSSAYLLYLNLKDEHLENLLLLSDSFLSKVKEVERLSALWVILNVFRLTTLWCVIPPCQKCSSIRQIMCFGKLQKLLDTACHFSYGGDLRC